MSRQRAVLALSAILMAFCTPVLAAQAMPMDSALDGSAYRLAGKTIPLPEGEWRQLSHKHAQMDDLVYRIGPFGTLQSGVLAMSREGHIAAILEVTTNTLPVRQGWGMPAVCDRQDMLLVLNRYRSGYDANCMVIGQSDIQDEAKARDADQTALLAPSQAFLDAKERLRDEGASLPEEWITVAFRIADRADLLDVRFSFNPQAAGIAPDTSETPGPGVWHPTRIEADPERTAYIAALADWGVHYGEVLQMAMHSQISHGTPVPTPFQPETAAALIAKRIEQLDRMLADSMITAEEYDTRRAQVESGKTLNAPPVVDAATVALWKTMSYRPLVSTANIFIDYFWIGQPFAAGVLVFLQVVVNTTKFYFHELAWSRFLGDSGGRREVARTVDVPVGFIFK